MSEARFAPRGALHRFVTFVETRPTTVVAILFVLALLPRLYVALAIATVPAWDGTFYHAGAVSIAEGRGYTGPWTTGGVVRLEPWSHYPVGYSAFLGGVYAIFGAKPIVGSIAGAFVGALTAVSVRSLAASFLSPARAPGFRGGGDRRAPPGARFPDSGLLADRAARGAVGLDARAARDDRASVTSEGRRGGGGDRSRF